MRIQGAQPVFMHADRHTSYLPKPGIDRLQMAANVASQISKHKHDNPQGIIYDRLVDSLVNHVKASVKAPELLPEDPKWSPAQRVIWRYGQRDRMPLKAEEKLAIITDRKLHKGLKAFAVVLAGRWLVRCPMPGCTSAQFACFTDRRFFCSDCAMKAIGGKWVEVVWPDDARAVETMLSGRPSVAQNWYPGEDAEDIAEQDRVAVGKPTLPDPSTFEKSVTVTIGGKQFTAPVLHYGTPEWHAAQASDEKS